VNQGIDSVSCFILKEIKMKLLKSIIISAIAIFATSKLLAGFAVDDVSTAVVAAVVLGILNRTLKPILQILTFPITIITLGLFSFVLNGFIIRVLASLMAGMHVSTLGTGILAAIIISIITSVLTSIFNDNKKKNR